MKCLRNAHGYNKVHFDAIIWLYWASDIFSPIITSKGSFVLNVLQSFIACIMKQLQKQFKMIYFVSVNLFHLNTENISLVDPFVGDKSCIIYTQRKDRWSLLLETQKWRTYHLDRRARDVVSKIYFSWVSPRARSRQNYSRLF